MKSSIVVTLVAVIGLLACSALSSVVKKTNEIAEMACLLFAEEHPEEMANLIMSTPMTPEESAKMSMYKTVSLTAEEKQALVDSVKMNAKEICSIRSILDIFIRDLNKSNQMRVSKYATN